MLLTNNLVEPETVLPAQFFATVGRRAPSKTGEFQLLVAMLGDAIHCFQKYALARDHKGQRLFRDAEQWMFENDEGGTCEQPKFSFPFVCEVLGIDRDRVRAFLRQWYSGHNTLTPRRGEHLESLQERKGAR